MATPTITDTAMVVGVNPGPQMFVTDPTTNQVTATTPNVMVRFQIGSSTQAFEMLVPVAQAAAYAYGTEFDVTFTLKAASS